MNIIKKNIEQKRNLMIYPIYVYGMPVLRKVAEPVPNDYPELKKLVETLSQAVTQSVESIARTLENLRGKMLNIPS